MDKDAVRSGWIMKCYESIMRPPNPDEKMAAVQHGWCRTYQDLFRFHPEDQHHRTLAGDY